MVLSSLSGRYASGPVGTSKYWCLYEPRGRAWGAARDNSAGPQYRREGGKEKQWRRPEAKQVRR